MTTDSEILQRLMDLEQWRAVHQKVCEIQNQVNESQAIALADRVDRGFNNAGIQMEKLDRKIDRVVGLAVKVGGVFIMLCVSGLLWYVSKDINKIHSIDSSSNIAEYRGKP